MKVRKMNRLLDFMTQTTPTFWMNCQKYINYFYGLISGLIGGLMAYFSPIQITLRTLIIFFAADVLFGYLKNKKLHKADFSTAVIWKTTFPRICMSVALVMLTFTWDTSHSQDYVESWNLVSWFISGVLLFSIVKNMYLITNWEIFPMIGRLIKKKIHDKSDIDIFELNIKTKTDKNDSTGIQNRE